MEAVFFKKSHEVYVEILSPIFSEVIEVKCLNNKSYCLQGKRVYSPGIDPVKILFVPKEGFPLTSLHAMFWGISSLRRIKFLNNFDTSNVTDMSSMFYGCKSLAAIDLSNLNTQNVTNMSRMFSGCESLKTIDLSNTNTQNVMNMSNIN